MPDLLSKGGPLVWLLLCCFGLALAIFAERLAYFHRASLNVGEFLAGLASLIRRKNFSEALQECVATRVPVGRVLHAALLRHHVPREQLKEIVQEAGQLEVPRLERYLSVLHGIAHAAPLIGLLGTIAGLMDTFTQLNNVNGYATPADVARGVYQSLITSALGLVVAIPSFLFYSFLAAKARHLMHDLERAGIEVVNILDDHREPAQNADTGAQIVEFRQSDSGMRKIGKNA
ncbi:MotA/TolQ/ExbB proton channel family protein [Verrucomicrobium sp. BvORR034]|jgi:biopolymer transport protein ExbB|uniref:MotA/TolQ/ExbB proton channel family protein n=1 Tax=Verrucomicrobium sp. BvORR034 TaxID=1396418 RepID=UPI000679849A|nr:MotA/TolQ/ExbB proton channel family protein [Verrucomicrobium sp. BvORR034]